MCPQLPPQSESLLSHLFCRPLRAYLLASWRSRSGRLADASRPCPCQGADRTLGGPVAFRGHLFSYPRGLTSLDRFCGRRLVLCVRRAGHIRVAPVTCGLPERGRSGRSRGGDLRPQRRRLQNQQRRRRRRRPSSQSSKLLRRSEFQAPATVLPAAAAPTAVAAADPTAAAALIFKFRTPATKRRRYAPAATAATAAIAAYRAAYCSLVCARKAVALDVNKDAGARRV